MDPCCVEVDKRNVSNVSTVLGMIMTMTTVRILNGIESEALQARVCFSMLEYIIYLNVKNKLRPVCSGSYYFILYVGFCVICVSLNCTRFGSF